MKLCTICKKDKDKIPNAGTWWNLNDYHKLSGLVCPECFELVNHESGKPKHPKEYEEIIIMRALQQSKTVTS